MFVLAPILSNHDVDQRPPIGANDINDVNSFSLDDPNLFAQFSNHSAKKMRSESSGAASTAAFLMCCSVKLLGILVGHRIQKNAHAFKALQRHFVAKNMY